MFYEVIYENGEHSIMSAKNDEEALTGLEEAQRRAVAGLPAGPAGNPSVRIKRVLKYGEHPVTMFESQAVNVEQLKAYINGVIDREAVGDMVSVSTVAAAVRDFTSPIIVDSAPHESNYKMPELSELAGSWAA